MKKEVEIISLIFKSIDYLHLIVNELKSDYCKVDGWDVGIRLVLNDATKEIIDEVQKMDIPYTIYNDRLPDDYYLNRVYRCWNYSVQTSKYENVCLVNSDMMFSKDWLKNLLKYHSGNYIPCSRLVESGKLLSGQYAISMDFGRIPQDLDRNNWSEFVDNISIPNVALGGLYMPCIFNKERMIESGMYPEGNIYDVGIGKYGQGRVLQSGDDYFFKLLNTKYGMKHITVFDSLVYHIQEGEKDS